VKDANGQQLAYLYFEDEPVTPRGIPYRGEHCEAAKRAAANFERHSKATQFSQQRRLSGDGELA
jgi:hypothetical protein